MFNDTHHLPWKLVFLQNLYEQRERFNLNGAALFLGGTFALCLGGALVVQHNNQVQKYRLLTQQKKDQEQRLIQALSDYTELVKSQTEERAMYTEEILAIQQKKYQQLKQYEVIIAERAPYSPSYFYENGKSMPQPKTQAVQYSEVARSLDEILASYPQVSNFDDYEKIENIIEQRKEVHAAFVALAIDYIYENTESNLKNQMIIGSNA